MTILDTSFLIDVLRNKPAALALINDIERDGPGHVPTVAIMELWEGALKSNAPEKEKKAVERLVDNMLVVNFDQKAAKHAAEIQVALKGSPIDVEDTMIGATARSLGEPVVTRDAHFARVPGLRVLKY